MQSYKELLAANQVWVAEKLKVDPGYFKNIAKEQRPECLWIGCSDSRVPAETITGARPGELFVHRNIANLVVHTDFNLLSVLQFAVEYLEVREIIVCGHYGCTGVQAALTNRRFGLLNQWLRSIKDVYRLHREELQAIPDPIAQARRMVELNVLEQVHNLARTSIVQRAWHLHRRPQLHAWVYGLDTGLLRDILTLDPDAKLDDVFTFNFRDDSSL
ncbi:MAG: carbonic anhydrase [Myxococcales bacterium]